MYGRNTYDFDVAELLFSLRNKAVWGNPNSIAGTTQAETKTLDSVDRAHSHFIPRQLVWIREGWLRFHIDKAFGLLFANEHTFTVGLFRFSLGRGIALGSAYAVGQGVLGFYTGYAIDQYASGAKFSGEFIKEKLSYDLYGAILQNKSSSLSDTGAKILGQQYGRLKDPARGFGKVNFVVAGRMIWRAFNNERMGSLHFEPYWLYNNEPERKVQFLGDASSRLATFGLASEYVGDKWEFGFDYAINVGRQEVKGWDRNQIVPQNCNGKLGFVNSHVFDKKPEEDNCGGTVKNGNKIPHIPNSPADELIKGEVCGPNDCTLEPRNCIKIGEVEGDVGFLMGDPNVELFNAINRFRDPYANKYCGWMFVADGSYWLYKKDLKVSFAAGVASGDDNPNIDTMDRKYSGFIGLQEIYSGSRVKSAFVLGGAGKLKRPLDQPTSNQAPSRFASVISGFTNLAYTGASFHWTPHNWDKKFMLQPNILAYWQQKATKKFDACKNKTIEERARTFLGVEFNTFVDFYMHENLRLFFLASFFLPGGHYHDIKGMPLDSEQAKILDQLDRTGFNRDAIPNIGTDASYTVNVGLEFRF